MSDTDNQWYFDLATGVVSQGKAGNWTGLTPLKQRHATPSPWQRNALARPTSMTKQAKTTTTKPNF